MGKVKTVTHNVLGIETKFNLNCGVDGHFSTKWPESITQIVEVEKTFGSLRELEKAVEDAVNNVNSSKEVYEDRIYIEMVSGHDGNHYDNISWKLRIRFAAYRRYSSGQLVIYSRIEKKHPSGVFSGFNFFDKEERKLYANYKEVIGENEEHVYVVEARKTNKGNGCYHGEINPNFSGVKSIPFSVFNYEKLVEITNKMKELGSKIDLMFDKAVEIGTLDFQSLQLIEPPGEDQ